MKKIRRKTKKHQKRIEKAGVKEKTKIKNFLKKVIDKYREWCYCMIVQNNKRKTKQRRLPTSSLCFFVFYLVTTQSHISIPLRCISMLLVAI